MKALIIGGGGFVGRYLAKYLTAQCGVETTLTKLPEESVSLSGCEAYNLDILDRDAVEALLIRLRPDWIFHLAAQSSAAYSWKNPQLTVDINIRGSLNVLDAVRDIEGYQPQMLLVGSGEEYGTPSLDVSCMSEAAPVHPRNPYAITKLTQNLFGTLYAETYGMRIVMVRAFNHIGPEQASQFVIADFCRQAAEITAGLREPVIRVGNLSAKRDFTDVRDVVRAYTMLMQKGKFGETYNVGSGKAVSIQSLLEQIIAQSCVEIKAETDPKKFRPVEAPILQADIRKLQAHTGWRPEIPLEQTIAETLAYWKRQIAQ